MRKYLFGLIAIMCFAVTSFGQGRLLPVIDTSTDAQVKYISTPVLVNSGGDYAFQYVGTKVSGTVAGTVMLQGSVDGTNYATLNDTLTLANVATNSHIWDVSATPRTKFRFQITTTGTVKVTNKGYYVGRKP